MPPCIDMFMSVKYCCECWKSMPGEFWCMSAFIVMLSYGDGGIELDVTGNMPQSGELGMLMCMFGWCCWPGLTILCCCASRKICCPWIDPRLVILNVLPCCCFLMGLLCKSKDWPRLWRFWRGCCGRLAETFMASKATTGVEFCLRCSLCRC